MKEKSIVKYEGKEQYREFLTVCLRYFDDNPKERLLKITRKNLVKMIKKFESQSNEVLFV